MAYATTVPMLPATAFRRQQRRCVTLQDARLAVSVGTPSASTPLMMTPTSRSTLGNAASVRAPIANVANIGSPVVRTAMRRCHSVPCIAVATFKSEQVGSAEASQQETTPSSIDAVGLRRGIRRSKTCAADFMKEMSSAYHIKHTHELNHTTLGDARFADRASTTSASTPFMMTPTPRSTFGNAASLRAPVANSANVRRFHSAPSFGLASFKAEQAGPAEASQQETIASPIDAGGVRHRTRRSKNLGAEVRKDIFVSVVGPGGGTRANACVYAALAKKEGFSVNILVARKECDRYPASWAKEGGVPAPNLESFALDLLDDRSIENTDCLVVGSRGGQVVLPTFWEARGAKIPPVVVMNGGCAMNMPTAVHWPETAVSFLLLGGQDYFRGHFSTDEYVKDVQRRVPKANSTTAILFVNEMTHMPQSLLLTAILHLMIRAATSWKRSGDAPMDDFQAIVRNLRKGAWSGSLSFKHDVGDAWRRETFP